MKICKSVKLLSLSFICSSTLAFAGLVNGIAVVVDKEPITLYEVHKISTKLKTSKRKALDMLVQKRLEDAQIKKLGISANKFEVDEKISDIATKNGITQYEFIQFLQSKNIKIEEYRKEIEEKIKQEKLYHRIFAKKINSISKQEIKRYYEANQEKFKKADTFEVVKYEAQDKKALEAQAKSPMMLVSGIQTTELTLTQSGLDAKSAYFLNQTNEGSFTPVLSSPNSHMMYLVKHKKNPHVVEFEKVKDVIEAELNAKQREEAITNYFEKLKAKAEIVVIRKP